jgi:hypothetical protein
VLVGEATTPPDGAFHGFVRARPGDLQLIDVPGTSVPCTVARWINQRGDIVGFFAFVDNLGDCTGDTSHGFLLRHGRFAQMSRLNSSPAVLRCRRPCHRQQSLGR